MPDSPSSLARYRPVVYVTVGVAAALTFYSFYTSFQTANPSSNLHRSNAIQRPRRQRSSNLRSAENRTQNESFLHDNSGLWHVPITLPDGHTEILPISQTFTGLPTLQGLQVQYGVDDETAERLRYELELAVVGSYLRSNYPDRQRFMVLDPDVPNITDYLESRGISRQAIRNGYELINREQSTSAPLVDGTNDQDGRETIAGTEVSWETTGGIPHPDQSQSTDAQNLKSMLYYIAEDQARQDGYVHRGVTCNACDMKPIRGVRWRCANCPDYDLCSDCEASGVHIKTHVFYKIRIPAPSSTRQAQPVMYPGKPTLMATYLPAEVKKRLCFETKFEPAEVDAYWDQFTCLANTIWEADPDGLRGAIDRKAFDKSFAHFYASMPPIPNLIYDRAFSLYDSNADNYIGFSEFLTTLSVLQSRQPNKKLRKIYNGYDLDGDGLVSRRDFLRIFRANFALQREITREAIMCQQDELSAAGAMNVVLSSQPLSSAFADIIPPGDPSRPIIGKSIGRYGDEKWTYSGVTFENVDETVTRAEIIRRAESARTGGSLGSAEDDSNDDAIEKRWLRREFYVDEEEGLSPPPGFENETDEDEDESEDDDEVIGSLAGGAETDSRNVSSRQISPRSRSSSKVRFQDDLEFETRSNASTSSRPMNERWGGYEIPEAERDLGKDVLYQVTQQGLNELLDTLFREKEDLAVEVKVTKQERRTYRSKISEYSGQQKESTLQADMHAQDESIKAALQDEDMARKLLMEYLQYSHPAQENGIPEPAAQLRERSTHLKTAHERRNDHQTPPDETRLKRLVFLEEVERESRLRGGGGKLSWQEFEKIYKENGGRTGPLGFIEGWLEIATF
ncbi:hypothetical protein M501DRAFT_944491 [Patellaria atrata CBS 101060]|uniref:EF-hand n=1 Tax=Patellaria atrata CBS 101060 TaxID=1346257 RepID=A0A9P4VKC4_9PEZI|nr:hypothetical protein M501DRAFT_944491 [Patellaria atrata CBS 101060]